MGELSEGTAKYVQELLAQSDEGHWTVRADSYDRLANAARALRSACKDRLPPGHYAKLDEECRELDAALHSGPGGS